MECVQTSKRLFLLKETVVFTFAKPEGSVALGIELQDYSTFKSKLFKKAIRTRFVLFIVALLNLIIVKAYQISKTYFEQNETLKR